MRGHSSSDPLLQRVKPVRSVKDVPGQSVKDVMGLNTSKTKGAARGMYAKGQTSESVAASM
ncbi:MAG: hypothetical protein PVS2B2_26420 [Candidatus Acidiferrum sp.]